MSGQEIQFGIKLKFDGSGFVGEVKFARDELNRLGGAGETSGKQLAAGMSGGAAASDRLAGSLSRLAGMAVGGLGFAAVAGHLVHTTDAMTNLESRLKLVTGGFNELAAAQASVFHIAQSTRSSLAATGDIYFKMSKGAEALGMSQAQVGRLTETIAQAMTLSGSSAESAKAALMQFGQALSSGVLRGEELNSVMEQAPALAEAIAKGMGKSVGELRKLGEAGELTVQQIMAALEKSAPEVARQFATLTPTISGAYQQLSNSAAQFIGQLDRQAHASAALASIIQSVSGNFEAFTAVAATTASVGLGGLIGKKVQAAAAARALAAEQAALTASTYSLNTALGMKAAQTATASTAMVAARGVLGALGGPIGMVTTLLAAGASAWLLFGDSAEEAGRKSAAALMKVRQDALERGQDATEATRGLITDKKRTQTTAFTEYNAANTPSEKSAIWKKYGLGQLSDDIRNAEEEVKKDEERLKNLAAKVAGMSTSDAWQKSNLSPARKQEHDLAELDKLYAAESSKVTGNQEKQIRLSAEYMEKRAVIIEKGVKKEQSLTTAHNNALAALDKSHAEADYKLQHAAIAISGAELDRRLKNNLVSYATYYDAKRELANQDNASNITRLQNEIAAEQNRGNKGTADEKYQSKARLIALQGQLNQAEADGAKAQSAITQQETESAKKYADERLDLTVAFLESQGNYEAAYALKFSKQYSDRLARMEAQGDETGIAITQGLFNSGMAESQLEKISKEFSRTQADLADAEKRISIDQQAGLTSEFEARQRLLELRLRFAPLMEAELSGLGAIVNKTDKQEASAKALKLALDSVRGSASELNRTFASGARNAIDRYLDDTGNAGKQTEKIFTDMFTGIEDVGANFIKTFKLDFHSLLETMGNDLAHLLSRQYVVAPLVSGVGSALGMPGAGGVGSAASSASNGIFGNAATSALGSSLQFSGTGGLASQGGAVLDSWLGTTATWDVAAGAQMSAAGELAASAGMFESAVAAIPGWGWALGGAALLLGGESLFGGDGDASRTGNFTGKLGQAGVSTDNHWFGGMDESFAKLNDTLVASEQTIIKNLSLSQSEIERINAGLDALGSKQIGFGPEHTDFLQTSTAAQQIMADRLKVIADSLGMTTQQLAAEMTLSTDTLKAAYNDAILTAAEKLALKTDAVRAAFERLGETMPSTIADYSKLVDAKEAAGDSARPLYRDLLKLAPAFAEVSKGVGSAQSALESAQKAIDDSIAAAQSTYDAATKNLQSSYQSEIAGKQSLADQMGKYVQSLRGYRDSLMRGTLGGLSPEARYAEARRQMEDVSRRAQLGDPAAIEQWQSASTAFLESSQAYNASSAAYVQDRDTILSMTQNLGSVAGRQVDLQSQQISVLRSQLDALGAINNSVLTVSSALEAYTAAKSGLVAAKGGDVSSWYAGIGRTADDAGADYWNNRVIAGNDAAVVKSDFERSALNVLTVEQMYQQFAGKNASQIDANGMNYWTAQLARKLPLDVRRDFEASVAAGHKLDGSHASGLSVVPFDGYRAELHKDEAVLDAPFMTGLRRYGIPLRSESSGGDNQETLAELKRQTALLLDMIDALVDEGRMTREELGVIHTRLAANDDAVQQLAVVMR